MALRQGVLIHSLSIRFRFEIIASQFAPAQVAHPRAEPHAPVAPTL